MQPTSLRSEPPASHTLHTVLRRFPSSTIGKSNGWRNRTEGRTDKDQTMLLLLSQPPPPKSRLSLRSLVPNRTRKENKDKAYLCFDGSRLLCKVLPLRFQPCGNVVLLGLPHDQLREALPRPRNNRGATASLGDSWIDPHELLVQERSPLSHRLL